MCIAVLYIEDDGNNKDRQFMIAQALQHLMSNEPKSEQIWLPHEKYFISDL